MNCKYSTYYVQYCLICTILSLFSSRIRIPTIYPNCSLLFSIIHWWEWTKKFLGISQERNNQRRNFTKKKNPLLLLILYLVFIPTICPNHSPLFSNIYWWEWAKKFSPHSTIFKHLLMRMNEEIFSGIHEKGTIEEKILLIRNFLKLLPICPLPPLSLSLSLSSKN